MNKEAIIAHIRETSNGWKIQSLEDHLRATSNLAEKFANEFESGDWAMLAGLYHDLGKFLPEWQNYIRKASGYENNGGKINSRSKVNHSTVGAVLSFNQLKEIPPLARILAYVIAGHHAGLPDWYPDAAGGDLQNRIFEMNTNQLTQAELNDLKNIEAASSFLDISPPKSAPPGYRKGAKDGLEHNHLWIRMLFSCLVDADYLDTESFMSPEKTFHRGKYPELKELKQLLDLFLEKKNKEAPNTFINENRRKVLDMCIKKAGLSPGFFSLTVPTGGGKTLSSMAFALEHCMKYDKKRVIMAIPYTSIIEQTAKVYKFGTDDEIIVEKEKINSGLFGDYSVVEHHSNLDPDKETPENRLATENWDAPIVVTTNVQLFESLFASRSSSCRKLHNLVNSVIILDEAQMLPPEYLKPILSILNGLVQHYGASVVLCTATQPSLKGSIGCGNNIIQGLENCREIVDDPEALNQSFNRVNISFPENKQRPDNWGDIAEQLIEYEKVLCIVNTRKDCRELHSLMPEGTIQLSALMCGEERSQIISNIKQKLLLGGTLRVISTQLVEAGVDIDFPVVFRAMAGLDSIAQAAGRCNREGKNQDKGKVFVFNPPKSSPPGLLRKGEDVTKTLISQRSVNALTPGLFDEYFKRFFGSVNDFDKPRFRKQLVSEADEFKFQFRTFSEGFKLIDDTKQRGIIIWFQGESGNSLDLVRQLKTKGPSRWLLRKLQRFTVNVPVHVFEKLKRMNYIEDINGYFVQAADGLYKPGKGLIYQEEDWIQQVYTI